MAGGPRGPFREKSLERLSSPERLDQLLRVVDRKSWLPLAAFAVLVGAGLLWSFVGWIPIKVEGRGILSSPREVVEIQAPAAGYLTELNVEVGDEIVPGQVVARIARPDLEKQLELQQAKAGELAVQSADMLRLYSSRLDRQTPVLEEATAYDHLRATRELARAMRDREIEVLGEERSRLQQQLRAARELCASLKRTVDGRRKLRDEGIVSDEALIATEQNWVEALADASVHEAGLHELEGRELALDERYLDRLQRIADREQQVGDVEREITRLRHLLSREGRIAADHAGRMLELSASVGSYVAPGQRIGSMTSGAARAPLESLSYFTVRDGKRIRRGDPIHVTPDTVERQRYGSIVGTVTEVSEFPATLAEAESSIGNRGLAETLIAGGYGIRVRARLHRDAEGRLEWTSPGGPDVDISFGTTTTARVPVERRRPIGFVLPWLKETAGLE